MDTLDYADLANSHIWYVCYGSNLRWERFSYYIKEGFCLLNVKDVRRLRRRIRPA